MPMLVLAAFDGHKRIVELLLEAGADPNLSDKHQSSALVGAAQEGRLDCIRLLLAAGADANICNDLGVSPLMTAIGHRHTECAEALLGISDLSITNRQGYNAFHSCIMSGNEECFDLLLARVNDLNGRTVPGRRANGEPEIVSSCAPLHLACSRGQHRMAKALLKRGADRLPRDSRQRTPLFYAAQEGHLACVVLLLGQPSGFKISPAEVSSADDQGFTALHLAALRGYTKVCGVLIEAGARLDAKTVFFSTPLMCAQLEHPTNAPLLALLSGAAPAQPPGTVCDHCGKTAVQASVSTLKACSQCQFVRYCSVECSVSAWPGHKAACKARAAEREKMTMPEIISPPHVNQLIVSASSFAGR